MIRKNPGEQNIGAKITLMALILLCLAGTFSTKTSPVGLNRKWLGARQTGNNGQSRPGETGGAQMTAFAKKRRYPRLAEAAEVERLMQQAPGAGANEQSFRRMQSQGLRITDPHVLFRHICNDPEWQDHTDLMLATYVGNAELVEKLIREGANPDARTGDGATALMYAAKNGRPDVAHLLLAAGADVNAISSAGWTALMHATNNEKLAISLSSLTPEERAGRKDAIQAVWLLIKAGADIHARSEDGWTPLALATSRGVVEIVGPLIERGAEINTQETKYGWTPLILAARNAVPSVLQALVRNNPGIGARTRDGRTALIHATTDDQSFLPGNVECVQLLLSAGVDVNASDEEGWTALMGASMYGGPDVVRELLTHGANVNARDSQGRTPLSLAISAGHEDIAELLKKAGAKE